MIFPLKDIADGVFFFFFHLTILECHASCLFLFSRPVVFCHALLLDLNWWVDVTNSFSAFLALHLPVCCVLAFMFSLSFISSCRQCFLCLCVRFSKWKNSSQACTVAVVKHALRFSSSRHQPGSAALSRDQSNGGRFWSSLCPQHQPWLLTPALWFCQRPGERHA